MLHTWSVPPHIPFLAMLFCVFGAFHDQNIKGKPQISGNSVFLSPPKSQRQNAKITRFFARIWALGRYSAEYRAFGIPPKSVCQKRKCTILGFPHRSAPPIPSPRHGTYPVQVCSIRHRIFVAVIRL